MNEEIMIKKLNAIIEEAIYHGGDSVGAYFTNHEGLLAAMREYLIWSGLKEKVCIINKDCGHLQFCLKSNIID